MRPALTPTLTKRGSIYTIRYWEDLLVSPLREQIQHQAIGVTGHRAKKLGGYGLRASQRLDKFCDVLLSKLPEPRLINNGMALGFDQAVCKACINHGVRYKAFIPCQDQEILWPKERQVEYRELVALAVDTDYTTAGGYNRWCMKQRDARLVAESTIVVALWDGESEEGGTTHTVFTALQEGKHVVNLWKLWSTI